MGLALGERMKFGSIPRLRSIPRMLAPHLKSCSFFDPMQSPEYAAQMDLDLNALRVLYRVVEDAHHNWQGGDPGEQNLLASMKQQLYAALMDHLFRSGKI